MKYRITFLFGALAACLCFTGCGDDSANEIENNANNANAETRTDQVAALEGDAAAGQSNFGQVCVTCHGTDGMGVGNLGNDLTVSTLSRDEVIDTIINGRGTMAGYDSAFSDQEIADLAAYSLQFRE